MKKTLFISILLILLSCSSDSENNSSSNNDLIIGKWTLEFEKRYDSNDNLIETIDASQEPCYQYTTYSFNINNQYIKKSFDFVNGDCVENPSVVYVWSKSGNIVTINGNQYILIENTASDLKLKIESENKILEYSKVN